MAFTTMDIYPSRGSHDRPRLGARCALIVLDFSLGNSSLRHEGIQLLQAVERTVALRAAFRAFGLPVAYTRISNQMGAKDVHPRLASISSSACFEKNQFLEKIVPKFMPASNEFIAHRHCASAFLHNSLDAWLIDENADTLALAGFATSGSVRATAIDALSRNFRTFVIEDCVGDVSLSAHESSLFDLDQKNVGILPYERLIQRISAIRNLT